MKTCKYNYTYCNIPSNRTYLIIYYNINTPWEFQILLMFSKEYVVKVKRTLFSFVTSQIQKNRQWNSYFVEYF